MEPEIEYGFIIGANGLYQTEQFLRICQTGLSFQPDWLIIIDAFPGRGKDAEALMMQGKILQSMNTFIGNINASISLEAIHAYYFFLESDYNTPGGGIRIDDANYNKAIEYSVRRPPKKIFIVTPLSIRHYLFGEAYFAKRKHPAYDHLGRLKSDASWVLDNGHSPYDAFLESCIGFAQPYPDSLGNGANILQEYFSFLDSPLPAGAKASADWKFLERVKKSIELSECNQRLTVHKKTVVVDAYGFGWFHTGTLIAKIQERYHETEVVVIKGNAHNQVTRKNGVPQVSIAFIKNPEATMERRLMTCMTEGVVPISPQYYHIPAEMFHRDLKEFFNI